MTRSFRRIASVMSVALLAMGVPVVASADQRGPVTNLPLPRFVSLKANEANARRGPDLSHRIDWVYMRRNLPLRVTAEFEHWRRVEDMDGQGGWIHSALLSGVRTALIDEDMSPLRARPGPEARTIARVERGVIATLQLCEAGWCQIEADGVRGWLPETSLWGVDPGETLE